MIDANALSKAERRALMPWTMQAAAEFYKMGVEWIVAIENGYKFEYGHLTELRSSQVIHRDDSRSAER